MLLTLGEALLWCAKPAGLTKGSKMHFRHVFTLSLAAVGLLFAATPASAATAFPASGSTGADISYPQCGGTYGSDLSSQSFGIVGVNGGRPMEPNSCFASELQWETGLGSSASVQVYVNTADPGNIVSDWPTSGTSPYGDCMAVGHGKKGANSTACAYVYGENEATYDVAQVGATNAASYQWWLDVETTNSWQSRHNLEMNQASLDGMLSVLPSGQVGVYSTSYQWGKIVGNLDSNSAALGALPQWIPTGQGSASVAQADCTTIPQFTTGRLVYTQYTATYDYDYAC